MSIYDRKRISDKSILFGDVFNHEDGREFTYIESMLQRAVCGFESKDGKSQLMVYQSLEALVNAGFKLNLEYVEKDIELFERGDEIIAPRKLKDGSWAGLSRLLTTTAIHVDFDEDSPFESRYCFSSSQLVAKEVVALYWLTRFKNKNSLPVGNCAYRGKLGSEPIASDEVTMEFKEITYQLKHKVMLYEGMDIHAYCNHFLRKYFYDDLGFMRVK